MFNYFAILQIVYKKMACREDHASPSTLFKLSTARHILMKCFTDIVYTVIYGNTYVQICNVGLTAVEKTKYGYHINHINHSSKGSVLHEVSLQTSHTSS